MPEIYGQKKVAIMNVARKVFAKYGYNKTTLDDIAEKVGMKKNSLYYYFPNKETLFNALIKIEAGAILQEMKELAASKISQTAKVRKFIGRFIAASRERAMFHSATVKAFLEIHMMIERSREEYKENLTSVFREILEEGIRKKEFRKHDTLKVSETLLRVALAVVQKEYYSSQAEFLSEIDTSKPEDELAVLSELILEGLKCR